MTLDKKEKAKIELYGNRSFFKRLNVTISFIYENWKTILRLSLIYIFPILLIYNWFFCGLADKIFMSSAKGYISTSFIFMSMCYLLMGILFVIVDVSFYFAIVQMYYKRSAPLVDVKKREVFILLKQNFIKVAWALFIVFLISFLFFELSLYINRLFLISLVIILFFIIGIPFLLLLPIYLVKGVSLWKSIKDSMRLGYRTWFSTFLFFVTMLIITGFISCFFFFPWFVVTHVESVFFATDEGSFSVPIIYRILIYVFSFFMWIGFTLSSFLLFTAMTYQYGHAASVKKHIIIADNIETAAQSLRK